LVGETGGKVKGDHDGEGWLWLKYFKWIHENKITKPAKIIFKGGEKDGEG
jgi:hypothetical protein